MGHLDHETFQTLWPSILVVVAMIGAMGWGIWKALDLMRSEPTRK